MLQVEVVDCYSRAHGMWPMGRSSSSPHADVGHATFARGSSLGDNCTPISDRINRDVSGCRLVAGLHPRGETTELGARSSGLWLLASLLRSWHARHLALLQLGDRQRWRSWRLATLAAAATAAGALQACHGAAGPESPSAVMVDWVKLGLRTAGAVGAPGAAC